MAENKKQTIVMMCSVVGCIVTLITCGILIGNVQADVSNLKDSTESTRVTVESIESKVSGMETKQAFLEGVVSTQLENIQLSQTELKGTVAKVAERVDDLTRVD